MSKRDRLAAGLMGVLLAVGLACCRSPGQGCGAVEAASLPPGLKNCTTVIVGKNATADGSLLLAHNEDLGSYSAQHYVVVPRMHHKPGETVTTWFGAVIPQVRVTFAYTATVIFDKAYVPGDVTSGMNEHQVAIANNLAYQREAAFPYPSQGRLIWTEFSQFALERAKTAREAVRIIGALAHTYGLCGSGTLFGVTDPNEGWWIEIAQEGQWVAQRVADDAADMRANAFRIGVVDFNDPGSFMYSKNLVSYARSRGWYHPGQGPFDFTRAYALPISVTIPFNTRRQWRVDALLDRYTPGVEPQDLMAILRDHYEGTWYDLTFGYKLGSPHDTSERTVCCETTEVASICQSRGWLPAEIGGVSWRAMATPCTGVFIPWYLGGLDVPDQFRKGTNQYSPDSAYWIFRRLSQSVDANYGKKIGNVRGVWEKFEQRELSLQAAVEQLAVALYNKDVFMAKRFLTFYSETLAQHALSTASKL